MNLAKKITQILSLILLIALASACDKQCFTNDEFDSHRVTIDANPISDGIEGSYDSTTGGQVAAWHNTGLKSNGDMFLIRISGDWTSWEAGSYDENFVQSSLDSMPVCRTCAKIDNTTPNCICYNKEKIAAEANQTCDPDEEDASSGIKQQDNPSLCSCTKDPIYGNALDYGIYHFPLDYFDKNEIPKIADQQSSCKFNRGMGAYIGLFGRSGISDPKRIYHLFTDDYDINGKTTKVCDIVTNSDGECKDISGKDRTSYVFKSANDRIFMKDDLEGNNGNNANTEDDVYHGPNEIVKLKIYDSYYSDNFGQYNINILKGVGDDSDIGSVGILEFMVRLVENTLLGEIKATKTTTQVDGEEVTTATYERQNGIIEFMYKGIVQDSVFVTALQVTLCLYVAFFGVAVLLGITEINKKELLNRLIKISLVIFFTNSNSWKWYNKFVVGLFYDSMNYVVSMFMSLSDYSLSQQMDTSSILIAQMDRSIDVSNATRFSYVDNMIKMMLSQAFAAKLFSLFFSNFFGILYIYLIIRLIIINFLKVMVQAATMYLTNMMQIIFVLCLGPIFITFSLFTHTKHMFQNWLSYLGARSLEIVLIFIILYNFVMLIDLGIRDLMDYSACVEPLSFGGADGTGFGGLFLINVLKASIDRSFASWITKIAQIAALIFITKLVLDKVMSIAGSLISIGGVGNKNVSNVGHGQDSANMAAGLSGGLTGGLAGNQQMFKDGQNFYAGAKDVAGLISRASNASGLSGALSKAGDLGGYNPLKIGREAGRNSLLDKAIEKAEKAASDKKLTGMDAAKSVRAEIEKGYGDPSKISNTAAFFGADKDRALARADQHFAKKEAAELKSQGLMGKELENQLRSNLQNYANQMTGKTSNSPESKAIMASLAKTIAAESKIDGKEAAALYANKPDLQSKYSQHLQDQAFKRHNKIESQQNKNNELSQNKFSSLSNFGKYISNVPNRLQSLASRGVDGLDRVRGLNPEQRNPDTAHQTFLRNLKNNERLDGLNWGHILNPLNRSNTLDRYLAPSGSSLDKRTDKSQEDVLRKNLAQDQKSRELPKLRDGATEKEKQSHEAARKKMDDIADKKREFFQDRLRNLATKDLAKEVSNINKLEKKGKTAEADKAKKELLSKTLNELKLNPNNKKSFQDDGRTLFEKAARLSYLHKQFGIAGEDPSLAISKALNKAVKDSSSDLAAKMAAGERSSKLAGAVEELGTLRSGIFNTASGDKEFNKLAATLGSTLDEIARRESEASLKSVGILSEDKKAKIEEDAQINRDKKEIQEQLNNLNKEFSKFREQEAERDAKEQEEKYQKERQDNMSQIFTLIEEIARLKTSSGDESEIKKLEENLRDKFATESETRTKHQIDKIEKQVDAAIADKSLESVKKLSEEISTLLETPVNKASSDSVIKGLESSNIGLTGSAEDLGLKGNILKSLLEGSAANALLGAGSTPETGTLTDAQKKELSMHKNQLNGQLKLNKMNLKLKEFELNELKKNKGDATLIAKIESDISDLEGKVDTLEREEKKLEPLTA